jgi:hypothetical protein
MEATKFPWTLNSFQEERSDFIHYQEQEHFKK